MIPTYTYRCAAKWTVVPGRCPSHAQWGTHRIRGWLPALLTTSAFSYRHFREISNSWKYQRNDREALDPGRHAQDKLLVQQFDKVRWDE